ncbi:MAG: hypothetical protein KC469_13035 [Flavobacteriaceae bacterium]|nr:hypothetical protein [Flavobacteriaceae bacterium]
MNLVRVFNYSLVIILFLMIALDLIGFSIWGQVYDVHESNLGQVTIESYYHFPRYILVYPAFFMNDLFPGVVEEKWFSFYVVFLYLVIVVVLSKIYLKYASQVLRIILTRDVSFALFFLVMSPLLFILNGRAIFGIFSASILLYYFSYFDSFSFFKKSFLVFLSLFTSMVSSGFVVIAFFSLFVIDFMGTKFFSKKGVIKILFYFLIITYLYDFISFVFEKNISFFGGGFEGVLNMLNHGFGRIFIDFDLFLIAMLSVTLIVFILLNLLIIPSSFFIEKMHILIIFVLSFFVGMFGYTSLAYAIPSFILLFLNLISKKRIEQRKLF